MASSAGLPEFKTMGDKLESKKDGQIICIQRIINVKTIGLFITQLSKISTDPKFLELS